MKILVSADIEGISGVNGRGFLNETSDEYNLACKLMTQEVNLVVSACFDAGAKDVYVVDGHGSGNNLIQSMLDSRAVRVDKNSSDLGMMTCVDKVDYCVFVGYHGRANVLNSYCAHTNIGKVVSGVFVAGVECGEALLNSLVAKYFGVKLLCVIGTDVAVNEVKEIIPSISLVITKESKTHSVALLKDNVQVYLAIKKTIKEAFENKSNMVINPINITDVKFEVKVPYSFLLEDLDNSKFELVNDRTVAVVGTDFVEQYKQYRQLLGLLFKKYKKIN